VIAVSRSLTELEDVSRETGSSHYVADVSKSDQIKALFSFAMKRYGRVDVLVNNAGSALQRTISEMVLISA
jgi:meso-butanediol dehydrogenase/(S,S)-butanediol dehydrogenase/diacetyl reductase